MNYEAVKVWIDLLQFVWMVVATIWVFWGNKNKEINDRVAAAEEKIGDHQGWLTRINERLKHLPTSAEMEEIAGDVKGLKAEMTGVKDALKAISRQLELINEYLLENKP